VKAKTGFLATFGQPSAHGSYRRPIAGTWQIPEITVQTLLALRKEDYAVRLITERLRVKEMGPAEHIRTKHEVKAFVQDRAESDVMTLLELATQRRTVGLKLSQDIAHRQSQSP